MMADENSIVESENEQIEDEEEEITAAELIEKLNQVKIFTLNMSYEYVKELVKIKF